MSEFLKKTPRGIRARIPKSLQEKPLKLYLLKIRLEKFLEISRNIFGEIRKKNFWQKPYNTFGEIPQEMVEKKNAQEMVENKHGLM